MSDFLTLYEDEKFKKIVFTCQIFPIVAFQMNCPGKERHLSKIFEFRNIFCKKSAHVIEHKAILKERIVEERQLSKALFCQPINKLQKYIKIVNSGVVYLFMQNFVSLV